MMKKLLSLLSITLLLTLLASVMLPASAAAKPSIQKGDLWVGSPKRSPMLLDWPDDAKILYIKSAKTSMLKVGKKAGFGPWGIWMLPLKIGKCRITIRDKLNGKTSSMSQVIAIKKYPNPIAWIKVNGKNVDLKKNKFEFYSRNYKKKTFTVSFKLNADWKLESNPCPGAYWIGDDFADGIKWKNGKSFKLPAKYDRLCAAIDIVNKSTGDFFNYEIWFMK
jgi:hypothetical protein